MLSVRNAATASIGACTSVGPGAGRAGPVPRLPLGAPGARYAGGALLHGRQIRTDRDSRLDAGSVADPAEDAELEREFFESNRVAYDDLRDAASCLQRVRTSVRRKLASSS